MATNTVTQAVKTNSAYLQTVTTKQKTAPKPKTPIQQAIESAVKGQTQTAAKASQANTATANTQNNTAIANNTQNAQNTATIKRIDIYA
jgi:hypothetical protein